ncbi:MAG: cell division protein FtsZ [Candidatus Pacebacteria bacterium]|nr:cell division protein FtsZ [Candidatus Paceibacterota bacterium]
MTSNTQIKVVGVGGSGGNAISRMMKCKIPGVDLIAINTDAQDLQKTRAHFKVRIGKEITQGLGTGMNPEVGKKAAEEQKEEIKEILKGSDMVFITCGLGGGTGTGASPVVAGFSKDSGILTVAVVTKPFSFEGISRQKIAEAGLKNLKEKVDCLISISNDKLLSVLDPNTPINSAFWVCDETLREAVSGISDLILRPGIINVNFADVKAIMKNSGSALFGVGRAQGENRAEVAAKAAINSPLLDISPKGAKGVLFNVSGGRDISLSEVEEIGKILTQEINPEAKVIFGAIGDEKLKEGELKVTIIATGF